MAMSTANTEVETGNGRHRATDEATKAQIKRQLTVYLPTVELMGRLKARTGLTTDEVVMTALMKLEASLGEKVEETKEQKMRRLAGLGDA